MCLDLPSEAIDGKIFNAGYENISVTALAQRVADVVGNVAIETSPTNDNRSYHVSSEKIRRELGFTPKHTVGRSDPRHGQRLQGRQSCRTQ